MSRRKRGTGIQREQFWLICVVTLLTELDSCFRRNDETKCQHNLMIIWDIMGEKNENRAIRWGVGYGQNQA